MSNRRSTLRVRAGVGAAFLVLAGLFLMHGLGAHGSMSAAEHEGMQLVSAAPLDAGSGSARVASRPGDGAGLAMTMGDCLAVLTLGLLLLVGRALSGRGPFWFTWSPVPMVVRRRARAPAPPPRLLTSVCRC